MYVCICEAVSEDEVRAAVAEGAGTVDEVGELCAAGTCCGSCHERIDVLLLAAVAPSVLAA